MARNCEQRRVLSRTSGAFVFISASIRGDTGNGEPCSSPLQGGSALLINDPANQINNPTSVDRLCYRVAARRPYDLFPVRSAGSPSSLHRSDPAEDMVYLRSPTAVVDSFVAHGSARVPSSEEIKLDAAGKRGRRGGGRAQAWGGKTRARLAA